MQALRTVPRTMSAAYEDILKRIEQSGSGDMNLAIKILSWLFYTKEPLSMDALREALVVDENDELQRDYILDPEDIIDCCKSLVVHETSSGFVRFTHYTVQEYIGTIESRLCSMNYLAKTCLNYLAMSAFDKPCNDHQTFHDRIKQFSFSRHAGKYWNFYTSGDPEKCHDIQLAVFRALRSEDRRDALIELSNNNNWFQWIPSDETFLHMIARAGLATICGLILNDGMIESVEYFLR
jgi:hypothetical protein